jgi:hypothetical protein
MSQDENDLLGRRAQRLSALLREADPPVPPIAFPAERIARAARRRTVVRWRVAAAIALLAIGAVGVRPVRAWILQAARVLWSAAAGPRRTAPPPARAPGASTVTFTPLSPVFVLRVAQAQSVGTLTIETTPAAAVSASAGGGQGGAELVVLPDGLRIVNDSAAAASYLVRLPATVVRIEVGIGRASPRVLTPHGPGARWVLDLRAVR